MCSNARSLIIHKDELEVQIFKGIGPLVVALTETRLTEDIDDSEINITGYSAVRCDGETRATGGVIIYIKEKVKYKVLFRRKIIGNYWCVAVWIDERKVYTGAVVAIYHSPSASDADFVECMVELSEELNTKGEFVILGDFNIDMKAATFYAKKLEKELLALGVKQYVKDATRITERSQTVIDLVYSNNKQRICVKQTPMITDHAWVLMLLKKYNNYNTQKEFIARERRKITAGQFKKEWRNIREQNRQYEVVDEKAIGLIEDIVNTLDIIAPKKKFKIPRKWIDKKWYTEEIKQITKERDMAYKRATKDNDRADWEQYRIYRNLGVAAIKNKKKKYYEEMIDNNKNNPTEMWKALKEVVRGKPERNIRYEEIKFEGEEEGSVKLDTVNRFNMYFIKSIAEIVSSIDNYDNNNNEENMNENNETYKWEEFDTVTEEELRRIIQKMDIKKGTEEGISTVVLKEIYEVISAELLDVVNSSLREGLCPSEWKVSTVTPIPKVNNTLKASEYRPINVLPTYEKVLEQIVKIQLDKFTEVNKILIEHQSGFRKNH